MEGQAGGEKEQRTKQNVSVNQVQNVAEARVVDRPSSLYSSVAEWLRASAKLEYWEAGSWDNATAGRRLGCWKHLGKRWDHFYNKKGRNSGRDVMCATCMQCAYCEPKWRECWQPLTHHPNRSHWGPILRGKKKADPLFLQKIPSVSEGTASTADNSVEPLKNVEPLQLRERNSKRNYTELTADQVFNGESTFSEEQYKKLKLLNECLGQPTAAYLQRKEPAEQHMLDHGSVWKQGRWYCKAALDVLVPGQGKYMLDAMFSEESRKRNKRVNEQWEEVLLQTAKVYLLTNDEDCRSIMFAQLCGWLQRTELNNLLGLVHEASGISVKTPHVQIKIDRYNAGKELSDKLNDKGCLPSRTYASRLSKDDSYWMLDWIKDRCPLGWKPGVIKRVVAGGEEYKFNVLQRAGKKSDMWKLFAVDKAKMKATMKDDIWLPGRGTFMAFLKLVTEEVRSKACLSYYYVRLLDTFNLYKRLVTDMEKLYIEAAGCIGAEKCSDHMTEELKILQERAKGFDLKKAELDAILKWAKYELPQHLKLEHSDCGGCGLHCIQHGLGGCDDSLHHGEECKECLKFLRCGHDLRLWLREWYVTLCRTFEKELKQWCPRVSSFCDDSNEVEPKFPGDGNNTSAVHVGESAAAADGTKAVAAGCKNSGANGEDEYVAGSAGNIQTAKECGDRRPSGIKSKGRKGYALSRVCKRTPRRELFFNPLS